VGLISLLRGSALARQIIAPVPFALLGLSALAPSSARAAAFIVDTTADVVDVAPGDGVCASAMVTCSLRAAIQEANALAGADEVTLPAGAYVLTIAGNDDACAVGDLDVTGPLTISGAGADVTTIDANAASRIFEIRTSSGPPLSFGVSGVTLRNGKHVSADGCDGFVSLPSGTAVCANPGSVTFTDAVVEGNDGPYAVMVLGSMTVTTSVLRNNTGSAVYVILGSLTALDTTVNGNGANGFDVGDVSTGVIRNTTISGNGATGISQANLCEPGFGCDPGDVTLNNVTITGNAVGIDNVVLSAAGGALGYAGTTLSNTIVAGNGSQCDGELISQGYNLVEDLVGCAITGDSTGNVVGFPAYLGPLEDNGGPTQTHALLAPSFAINSANPAAPGGGGNTCEAADQRGVVRPLGARCDIGAVESACGNGVTDAGEECDDGNSTDGDGCQHNCALPGCGDGVTTPPEQCDDGNHDAGDCCAADCVFEAADSSCGSDDEPCTSDVCDGNGQCTHPALDCGECLTCVPGEGCVPPYLFEACSEAAPEAANAKVGNVDGNPKDRSTWRWEATGSVTKNDFGNPDVSSAVEYRLCLYDDAGGGHLLAHVPSGCTEDFCWTETSKGFKLTSGSTVPGKVKALFTAGTPGKILFKTRGTIEGVPALPLTPPVEIRLMRIDTEECWNAYYDAGVRKNSNTSFSARSD
jgi:CSLREA domain-containing protein